SYVMLMPKKQETEQEDEISENEGS
ncbi:MAG TPA: RNA chaperone Hfq, partial [Thermotoga naphthophila]|nr:RNA chaperone Hfq [Thermotoga petrophila]